MRKKLKYQRKMQKSIKVNEKKVKKSMKLKKNSKNTKKFNIISLKARTLIKTQEKLNNNLKRDNLKQKRGETYRPKKGRIIYITQIKEIFKFLWEKTNVMKLL